ncbi:serine protease [Pseudomonas sp. 14P_8.1_Bac3]|uniref:trypsin-like serine peptidase n=1 Tax=Pseudomonas sp. 14P_8.1_Bac3 TaxID=2971621 RepID=UPI0021C78104|nr:serine protease [Pseudomonas sp. 14P_8.1_Bac3]MCU1760375.1 serine protease [Pseudomonas sp. 14P_8.1_Bac3]
MKSIPLLFISAFGLMGTTAFADTRDYGEGVRNLTNEMTLDEPRDHWRGIGRLRNDSACTATLIDTLHRTDVHTPAYVLTAGHCIDRSNGKITTHQPIRGSMFFNYFLDDAAVKSYPLKSVKWRSMQGVDIAVVELDISLQTLVAEGIKPLKLAAATPAKGSDVLIVGAPLNSILTMAACTLQPAADVVEGKWVWRNNFMTRCKDIREAHSGSPLLDRYTNEIIGVVGTVNDDPSLTPCSLNAPCTPTKKGYEAIQGNVYGNPVAHLSSCFRSGFMLEKNCPLYPTFNVDTVDKVAAVNKTIKKSKNGRAITPTWDYRFTIDTAYFRHKTVRVAKQCESPRHYSPAINSIDGFIDSRIGTRPGRYFLCIIGMQSEDQALEPGLLRNALSVPVVLTSEDTNAPAL